MLFHFSLGGPSDELHLFIKKAESNILQNCIRQASIYVYSQKPLKKHVNVYNLPSSFCYLGVIMKEVAILRLYKTRFALKHQSSNDDRYPAVGFRGRLVFTSAALSFPLSI